MPTDTTVADTRLERRAERFAARRILWAESRRSRLQKCGKVTVNEIGVQVRASGHGAERRAGFSGVYTCGSVWSCPVCSDKIQSHRRTEIKDALAAARERGMTVALVTLTMQHHKGDGLGALWLALSNAWNRATSGSGRWWEEAEAGLGVRGYIRTVETTVGENGWHVHVHALLFLDGDLAKPVKRAHLLGAGMFDRWQAALRRRGFDASVAHGVDVRVIKADADETMAEYLTKGSYGSMTDSSAAFEVTGSTHKTGRSGSRTPFQVLQDVVRNGDEADLVLWHEWERVSAGKLQLLWTRDRTCKGCKADGATVPSERCDARRRLALVEGRGRVSGCRVGLRRLLGLGEEIEDQEVIERETLDGDVLTVFTPTEWTHLRRRRLEVEVLRLAEVDDGGRALLAWRTQTLARLYVT